MATSPPNFATSTSICATRASWSCACLLPNRLQATVSRQPVTRRSATLSRGVSKRAAALRSAPPPRGSSCTPSPMRPRHSRARRHTTSFGLLHHRRPLRRRQYTDSWLPTCASQDAPMPWLSARWSCTAETEGHCPSCRWKTSAATAREGRRRGSRSTGGWTRSGLTSIIALAGRPSFASRWAPTSRSHRTNCTLDNQVPSVQAANPSATQPRGCSRCATSRRPGLQPGHRSQCSIISYHLGPAKPA